MAPDGSKKIAQALKAFQEWRDKRKKRGRIPDELWILAVGLLTWYRPSHICKTLKLNQTTFKHRAQTILDGTCQVAPGKDSCLSTFTYEGNSAPAFVQLEPLARSPELVGSVQAVIDQAAGNRISLQIPSASTETIRMLIQTFLDPSSCSR